MPHLLNFGSICIYINKYTQLFHKIKANSSTHKLATMNFFTFKLRSHNTQHILPTQKQIVNIIQLVANNKILSFQPSWVENLLTLFGSKEEMQLFWTMFTQAYMPQPPNAHPNIILRNIQKLQKANNSSQKNSVVIKPTIKNTQQPQLEDLPLSNSEIDIEYEDEGFRLQEAQISQLDQQSEVSQSGSGQTRKESFLTAAQEAAMCVPREKSNLTRQIAEAMKKEYKICKQNGDKFIVRQYADKYNVHKTTIYRLMNKWQNEILLGKLLIKSNKYNKRAPNKGTVDYQIGQWTKSIETLVKQNPYLSVQQIKSKLKLQGFVFLPTSSNIRDILTTLKYSAKKSNSAESKKSSETVYIRKRYCEVYLGMLKRTDLKIFFVDEKKFDLTNNDYGWSKPNSLLPDKNPQAYVSLFVILCQDGSCYWETFPNSTSQSPNRKGQLEPIFQSISSKKSANHNIITVTNKESIQPDFFRGLISKYQWKMLILPPGSPELNPAFYFFKEVKSRLKKILPQLRNAGQIQGCLKKLCPSICEWKSKFQEINSFAEFGVDSQIIA